MSIESTEFIDPQQSQPLRADKSVAKRSWYWNAVVWFASVGCAAELFLLSRCPTSIYRTDWTSICFAVLYGATFWFGVGCLVSVAVSIIHRAFDHDRLRGYACLVIISELATVTAAAYVVSWGYFLESGRFLDLDTVRFCLQNAPYLVDYLSAAEPVHLVVVGLAFVSLAAFIPLALRWVSRKEAGRISLIRSSMIMVSLVVLTRLCWNSIPVQRSSLLQAQRIQSIRFSVHPTFAPFINLAYQRLEGQIERDLDVRQLRDRRIANSPSMPPRTPSIIVVAVESLRFDTIHQHHQSIEVLPNINQLATGGLHFTRAYAQSTHSDYADVCIVSSLYPLRTTLHHYYSQTDPWPKTLLYDILKPLGYSTAIISSQNECWGGMSHFLASENLDLFYHPQTHRGPAMRVSELDNGFANELKHGGLVAGKFPDVHTTDVAIGWIRKQVSGGKPFFLCMNFQSSHFPYLLPDDCARPFQPCQLGPKVSFVDYPKEETPNVRNAYFNAIHECDRQIGRLLATLREIDMLNDTILIVTGENGEAFHECGTVTHARAPVEPALHVACVLHAPRLVLPKLESYPLEHVDLAPTIMGLMGLPSHPNFQGIDVLSESRPPLDQRLTFAHVQSSFAYADAVIMGGRWKLTRTPDTGLETLHDLQNDPWQEHDVASRFPTVQRGLSRTLREWRRGQLAYYKFPEYYLTYYPPSPPRLGPPDNGHTMEVNSPAAAPIR